MKRPVLLAVTLTGLVLSLHACAPKERVTTAEDMSPITGNDEAAPSSEVMSSSAALAPILPDRLEVYRSWSPTSEPHWVTESEHLFEDWYGNEIRVFNGARTCRFDAHLLYELTQFGGTVATRVQHEEAQPVRLELRLLPSRYLLRTPENFGFTMSEESGEYGLTVSSAYQVNSLVATRFARDLGEGTSVYEGDAPGMPNPVVDADTFLTRTAIHELLVHGYNRAMDVERTEDEEHIAQWFDLLLYERLDGRPLIQCNE
jgi:hypothetical protein